MKEFKHRLLGEPAKDDTNDTIAALDYGIVEKEDILVICELHNDIPRLTEPTTPDQAVMNGYKIITCDICGCFLAKLDI
jgi:hypothetical protein